MHTHMHTRGRPRGAGAGAGAGRGDRGLLRVAYLLYHNLKSPQSTRKYSHRMHDMHGRLVKISLSHEKAASGI